MTLFAFLAAVVYNLNYEEEPLLRQPSSEAPNPQTQINPDDSPEELHESPALAPQQNMDLVNVPLVEKSSDVVKFKVEDGVGVVFGDMIVGEPLDSSLREGLAKLREPKKWPQSTVPFYIVPDLHEPERVQNAIQYMNANTSIRLVPLNGEKNAIVFEEGTGHCKSYVGMVGGHQPIKLAPECGTQEILHEIMHALGFIHEQSRSDRDRYIRILWENIEEARHPEYQIAPEFFLQLLPYGRFDFRSIMMYKTDTFALSPRQPTMESLNGVEISPVEVGLSEGDIARVKNAYPPLPQ